MKNIRVLLCGTVFGRIYLRGIKDSQVWKLSGILSRGSEKSAKLAERYNVPLYKDVDDVPEGEYDVAFVVVRSGIVGGEGHKLAGRLLDKHINVVQEQPVHAEEAAELFKRAAENDVSYTVNTFYPYMDASKQFFTRLSELKKNEDILSIDGCCSLPVLLPFIDQIGRAAGGLRPWNIDNVLTNGACDFITGNIRGIPFSIRLQGRRRENINQAYILNQINVMTASGNLIMTDVNGQVIWIKKPYVVEEYIKAVEKDITKDVPATEIVYDAGPKHFSCLYRDTWPKAVERFLEEKEDKILSSKPDTAEMQYYLSVCGLWKELYKMLEDIR